MDSALAIASICRGLPSPANPSDGIFVLRRLEAMSRQAILTTLQPVPHFPLVAPLPDWAKRPYHDINGLRIEHVPMFYVPKYLKSLDGMWLYRAILARLAALKAGAALDVVDAHFGYPEGVGAYWAARALGVPVFVTLRGFEAEYLNIRGIGSQIRQVLRNVDGCICVAHYLQQIAIDHGADPERTCVIHNAIDRRQFHPADRAAARRKLALPADAPVVISVGHLTSRKRHHVLITAFAKVLAVHPTARLIIIGGKTFEPDYPDSLKRLVGQFGIAYAVDFLGNIDTNHIAGYLQAASVFALGTQREGCCNAVLESLACGIPVVTTPVGDNAAFVENGKNGYLVPVDDAAAMAHALSSAIERTDWDQERIATSLEVGDWDQVATQVLTFLERQRCRKAKL